MCDPISIGLGVVSAGGGMMQAQAQHNAQKAAVARQNQIAHQQYQQELQIQGEKSRQQKDAHKEQVAAHAKAANDLNKQYELNQMEANRAGSVIAQKKSEKDAKSAFEMEEAVSKAIQAQGQLLSTGKSGQSFLLQTEQAQRELGFATAQIEQNMFDANKVYLLEQQGLRMDQYSRDAQSFNSMPAHPRAQRAPFLPYKPIQIAGPSKGALMGAMIGAAAGGAQAGFGASDAISDSKWGKSTFKQYQG